MCHALLPSWSNVVDVELTNIPGGITNELRVVVPLVTQNQDGSGSGDGKLKNPKPKQVVLRVFGKGTDSFLDRKTETAAVFELNALGVGAVCLGVFGNGRVEEFLHNVRPLMHLEMASPEIAKRIARLVARFHALRVEARAENGKMENETTNTLGNNNSTPFPKNATPQPARIWDVMRAWQKSATAAATAAATATSITIDGETKTSAQQHDKQLDPLHLASLAGDIDALERSCAAVNSPTVLCHNDLLPGNFLLRCDDDQSRVGKPSHPNQGVLDLAPESSYQTKPRANPDDQPEKPLLTLIDFEYSCYGPRGFDLANHFLEYAGFTGEWGLVPDAETRGRFFVEYLKARAANGGANEGADEGTDESVDSEHLKNEVSTLSSEVNAFFPVSHLWWGLWAAMMTHSNDSAVGFDYASYAAVRLREFRKTRHEDKRR